MADNVEITAGSGTPIATDQVGTNHYQKIKLVDGTNDQNTPVAVDIGVKANALRIAPANDITAGTYIGSVGGDVAQDAVDSGNPIKVGGKAYNLDGTPPGTVVVENDRSQFITDVYGRQFVETAHPNLWSGSKNSGTSKTNYQLKAAPGAGLSLYITDIIVTAADIYYIKIIEDTVGTPVVIVPYIYLKADDAVSINLRTPIKVAANKNVGYTTVASSKNHSVLLCGFIAP